MEYTIQVYFKVDFMLYGGGWDTGHVLINVASNSKMFIENWPCTVWHQGKLIMDTNWSADLMPLKH